MFEVSGASSPGRSDASRRHHRITSLEVEQLAVSRFDSILRRALGATAALTIALGAAACGGDSTGSSGTRYNVVSISVNGVTDNSAPFLIAEGTDPDFGEYKFEVVSAYIELIGNNRYRVVSDVNAILGGAPFPFDDTPEEGTYSVSGNTYTFTPSDDSESPYTATLSNGNTLTYTDQFESVDGTLTLTIVARK